MGRTGTLCSCSRATTSSAASSGMPAPPYRWPVDRTKNRCHRMPIRRAAARSSSTTVGHSTEKWSPPTEATIGSVPRFGSWNSNRGHTTPCAIPLVYPATRVWKIPGRSPAGGPAARSVTTRRRVPAAGCRARAVGAFGGRTDGSLFPGPSEVYRREHPRCHRRRCHHRVRPRHRGGARRRHRSPAGPLGHGHGTLGAVPWLSTRPGRLPCHRRPFSASGQSAPGAAPAGPPPLRPPRARAPWPSMRYAAGGRSRRPRAARRSRPAWPTPRRRHRRSRRTPRRVPAARVHERRLALCGNRRQACAVARTPCSGIRRATAVNGRRPARERDSRQREAAPRAASRRAFRTTHHADRAHRWVRRSWTASVDGSE